MIMITTIIITVHLPALSTTIITIIVGMMIIITVGMIISIIVTIAKMITTIIITYLHSPPLSTFEKTSTPSLLSSIIISGDTLIRNHNDDHNQSRGGKGC